MSAVLAAALAACAVLALPGNGRARAHSRVIRLRGATPSRATDRVWYGPAGRRLAAGVLGLGLFAVVGGSVGALAGVVAAVACARVIRRLEPPAERRRRERLRADLPVAADLLAACLLAGSPLPDAARAVADAVDGPLGERLRHLTATLRLGADPADAWRRLAEEELMLAPLARTVARTVDSGAPLADAMARLAERLRLERRWAAEARARRVGVQAAAPLGLCFLPAFVLIGVVPVVIGLVMRFVA